LIALFCLFLGIFTPGGLCGIINGPADRKRTPVSPGGALFGLKSERCYCKVLPDLSGAFAGKPLTAKNSKTKFKACSRCAKPCPYQPISGPRKG
jgi:hypothetical protein